MPQEAARGLAREERRKRERIDPLPDIRESVRAERQKMERVAVQPLDLKERLPTRR